MRLLVVFAIVFSFPFANAFTLIFSSLQGWDGEELGIDVNLTDCPEGLTAEIEEAFEVWNQVSTAGLKLKIGNANNDSVTTIRDRVLSSGTPTEHPPVLVCDTNFGTTFSSADPDSTLGVGSANAVNSDRLNTGFIVLNVQSGADANINNQSAIQRKIVIAHELGHMLGIGHSAQSTALMFFNIGSKENLNLHQDDADAYSYLYPKTEPSDGFLGCGSIQKGGDTPSSPLFWLLFFMPLLVWSTLARGTRQQLKMAPVSIRS